MTSALRRLQPWMVAALTMALLVAGSMVWVQARPTESVNILMPAPFADATQPLVKRFNQEHHGRIRLTVTRGPLETEAISDLAISSLLLGDTPFDALLMDITWVPKYVAADWLQPLDPWFGPEAMAALAEGVRAGNSINDVLYRWPLVASMGLLYWRTDLIDQPPRTPQELVTISRQLQADGRVPWGYVWEGRQYEGLSCVVLELVHGFGGFWFQPDQAAVGLNQPQAIAAVAWLRQLISEGISPEAVTNYAEPEALQSFKAGDAAFMRNWPYAWAELQQPGSAVRGRVGITTMVANSGDPSTATLGSWGLSMLRGSAHPEATATAMRFLSSTESQKALFLSHGYTPTAASLYRDPELIALNPILPQLEEALEHALPRPETPLYAQISDVLQRDLSASLTGQQSAAQGMERASANTEAILRSAGGTP
jgi:multiple sugar transport system substrate-binding protein